MTKNTKNEVDLYLEGFSPEIRVKLEEIRLAIRHAAPDAVETIKYGMPSYVMHKNLVHFAGHLNHVGFYPAPSGMKAFEKELSAWKTSKAAVQFPYNQPIPTELVEKIVRFRLKEDREMAELKKQLKK